MEALIIDPALHSIGGHHFSAHQRVVKDLHSLGVSCRSLGSKLVSHEAIEALGTNPCFSNCLYSRTEWTREEYKRHVAVTRQELARALRWKWPRPDLLVLPCSDQVLTSAVARHLKGLSQERMPHIVMWLLFPPDVHRSFDGDSDPNAEYAEAFAELRTAVGSERIAVYCETESLAEIYGNIIGLNIAIAPGPNLAEGYRPSTRSSTSEMRTICCTGHANAPKGYRLLPDAVGEVLKQRRDVRFKIHGTINSFDVEKDFRTFQTLATMSSRVIVHDRVMSQEEYLGWLTDSDLLLLPYDPLVYRNRGSGVFSEAVILGLPAIAPLGCAFAQSAFEARRAVPIEHYDSMGIAVAILKALDYLPDLSARAKEFANTNTCQMTSRRILESSLHSILTQRSGRRNLKNRLSEVS